MDFKALPHNIEAEQGLLGGIIAHPQTLTEVMEIIKHDDLYRDAHQLIYNSIYSLFTRNESIDLITVINELKTMDALDKVGGITYLTTIIQSGLASNVKSYANIIKELSNKRKLIKIAQDLMQKGHDEKSKSKDILVTVEEEIFKISSTKENRMIKADELVGTTLQNIEKLYNTGGGMTGASTEFSEIDRITRGLQKQDLVILAARPSMGKTTLAENIASNVAKKSSVIFFSLEMSNEQLMAKMLSADSMVKYENVKSGQLQEEEWIKLSKSSALIANKKLFIDDTAARTVNEIKAQAKKIKLQHGLDLIVIDYLQLMKGTGGNREQEISGISQGLKAIAKELNCTVIALSQLSRACEQRVDKRPMLSDLRESGSIEQDADIVMFLYRDEYYNKETEEKNVAECIFGKNRNGRVGAVKLAWLGEYQKFGNLDLHYEGKYNPRIFK
jgi:replicative DNA helicase